MAVRFQLRRDTAANWAASNPTLALGEPGVETDTLKLKVGDGSTAWNSLAYSITKDFTDLTSTPTTIAGYGITDAVTLAGISVTQNAANGLGALTYNNTTGVFTYTPPDLTSLGGDIVGSVFADDSTVMVDGISATLNFVNNTTTDLTEGTNLYYTDARADARITAILQDDDTFASPSATNIASSESIKAYVDAQVASKDALSELSGSTDDVLEGSTNLYYTDARVGTYISGNRTYGNITTTGYIAGPATFTIDPAAVGDNTGTVVIAGNLQVDGTTTTINSTTVEVDDKNIVLSTGALNKAASNGAGITVDNGSDTDATILYDGTNDLWSLNKELQVDPGYITLGTSVGTDNSWINNVEDGNLELVVEGRQSDAGGIRINRYNSPSGDTTYFRDFDVYNGKNGLVLKVDGSAGRVGIGTDSPDRLLTLSGTGATLLSLVSTDDDNCQVMFGDSASDTVGKVIYRHADNRLTLQAGDTETVHVVGGRVGINFNNPSADIHVLGTSGSPNVGLTLQSHDTANATSEISLYARDASNVNITSEIKNVAGQLFIERSDSGTDVFALKSTATGAGGPQLDFYHHSSSPADNDVVGTINFNGWDDGSNATTYARVSGVASDVTNGVEKGDLVFSTRRDGSTFDEKFRIAHNGNVSIGTVSPLARLHVDRSTSDAGQRVIYADGTHDAITTNGTNYLHNVWIENHNFDIDSGVVDSGYRIGLNIEGYHDSSVFEGTLATQKNIWSRNGNNSGGTGTITNSYNLHLETLSGGGMTITNNYGLYQSGSGTKNYFEGDVGIGTNDPAEKLHVRSGDIAIDAAGSGNTASLKFINDNERSRITSNYDTSGGGRLGFWTDTTGGSLVQRMTIDSAGYVGIQGATDPEYEFDHASNFSSGQTKVMRRRYDEVVTAYNHGTGGSGTSTVTVTLSVVGLRGVVLTADFGGSRNNSGPDNYMTRICHALMSEGTNLRRSDRLTGLEFAVGATPVTVSSVAMSTDKIVVTYSIAPNGNAYDARMLFTAKGPGIQDVDVSVSFA